MKKSLITVATLVVALSASGCATQYSVKPHAVKPAYSEQTKIQAASHWRTMAENEAKQLSVKLNRSSASVFVREYVPKDADTPFRRAYANFITEAMLNQNVSIDLERTNANIALDYDVQVIVHKDQDSLPFLKPGYVSALVGSAYIIGVVDNQWSQPARLALGLAPLADYGLYTSRFTDEPVTEVIVTTRLSTSTKVIASSSNVYYFNSGDISLYERSTTPTVLKTVSVVAE